METSWLNVTPKHITFATLLLREACETHDDYWGYLVAAAGEVKAYHHLLQLSSIAVHMYHALQLMQAKVLIMKFWEWKFCGWSVKNYIPQEYVAMYTVN